MANERTIGRQWKKNEYERFIRDELGFVFLREAKGSHKIYQDKYGIKVTVKPKMNPMVAERELKRILKEREMYESR